MSANAKPPVGVTARRGDIFVMEVEHSYTLAHGGTKRRIEHLLGVVTSITREGRVRAYRVAGDTFIRKSAPCGISLISRERLDVAALEAAYVTRGEPHAREFNSLEAAREFIRPHLRSSGPSTTTLSGQVATSSATGNS